MCQDCGQAHGHQSADSIPYGPAQVAEDEIEDHLTAAIFKLEDVLKVENGELVFTDGQADKVRAVLAQLNAIEF